MAPIPTNNPPSSLSQQAAQALKSFVMSDAELKLFADYVDKLIGVQINASKKALLVNRLSKRVRELNLESFAAYFEYVRSHKEENQRLIDAVTTNETYFFRAPKLWEYFAGTMLPEFYKNNPGKPIEIWCAAASSGEEPYTIGVICEEFKKKNPGFSWRLKASDISDDMLVKCKAGQYAGRSIEKVEPRLLKTYFQQQPDKSVIASADLKKNIVFFKHNLMNKTDLKGLDIVFIRNVLIYFDAPTKEKIFNYIHDALKPGGTLVVGESEGLINSKIAFKYVQPSIYLK